MAGPSVSNRSDRATPTCADVGIPLRNLRPRFPENAPVHFAFDGNPLVTSLFAVFSGIFPPGERFFMTSVRRFRNRIDSETLAAEVTGFLGQEALHGREHDRLNEYFAAHGFDMTMPDRTIRFSLDLLTRLSPTQQLACTTFMEHFTANLAEQWLTDETLNRTSDPEMLPLWHWHAIEELEHKAVAFDVHELVSGRYDERLLAGPLVVAALLPGIVFSWAYLLARRGEALELREHARGLRAILGRDGFITKTLRGMPSYYARDFHPRQHDTSALEDEWREKLFGPNGVLRYALRGRDAARA